MDTVVKGTRWAVGKMLQPDARHAILGRACQGEQRQRTSSDLGSEESLQLITGRKYTQGYLFQLVTLSACNTLTQSLRALKLLLPMCGAESRECLGVNT